MQKTKLINFGATDDFSIEIETNFEMFANKNKQMDNKNLNEINAEKKSYNKNADNYLICNTIINQNNSKSANNNTQKSNFNFMTYENNKNNLYLKKNVQTIVTSKNFYSPNDFNSNNNRNQINNVYRNNRSINYINTDNNKYIIRSQTSTKPNLNQASKKSLNPKIEEIPIFDKNFDNSNINENSEVRYQPCKTLDNVDIENSRCIYLKRNMMDDMDSIIYNNIEKLFENNINTKQINNNKNLITERDVKNQYRNLRKNQYKKNDSNTGSILNESESYYDDVNYKNIYHCKKNNKSPHKCNEGIQPSAGKRRE